MHIKIQEQKGAGHGNTRRRYLRNRHSEDSGRGKRILDFSANINPLGMPESVRQAVMASLSAAEHYPDPECRKLKQALARRHGIKTESLICGNGGAELIYRLAYALRPKKALLTAPTFENMRSTSTDRYGMHLI